MAPVRRQIESMVWVATRFAVVADVALSAAELPQDRFRKVLRDESLLMMKLFDEHVGGGAFPQKVCGRC
jgi:hypothetical protein